MSQFTIDIDTGGTFTDGFITLGDQYQTVKVDTTPHDLTVCFNKCISEGAKRFGYEDVDEFLRETRMIRFSTTVGTNSIIQKTGPKLGLIVTKGYEDTLYQDDNPILNYLVDPELVVGINESVSIDGELELEAQESEIRSATKQLLEAGARAFVVSLKNAHLNMENEKRVREIIEQDFPTHYLGAKTILLSSEISKRSNDGIRTNAGIVNAYLHQDMVKYLYKADEGVRNKGFTNHLLIAHSNGGVARVAKTKAIDTYNSGPAAGIMGSVYTGQIYGIDNILTVDVGGTSTDVGLIRDGNLTFDNESTISGIPVHTPLIHVLSVGGGGGSIAKVNNEGTLQLGPESAGAVPGPACFDLGGTKPTVTDAVATLKWIDPDYFLAGTKKLKESKGIEAIEQGIASKLNIPVEEAAFRIIDELTTIGANALKQLTSERGYRASEFSLYSFGGGGGLFSGEIARKSGISQVYTFPFSSVFSAFGLSTADVNHVYETRLDLKVNRDDVADIKSKVNNELVNMTDRAYRDMRGEGFQANEVHFHLELEGTSGENDSSLVIKVPLNCSPEHIDLSNLDSYFKENDLPKDLKLQFLRLRSWAAVPHYRFTALPLAGTNANDAIKTVRQIGWNKAVVEANIYDARLLQPGNRIKGPAIVESVDTTFMVPPGTQYHIDQYLNGILEV